jgi:hypothetical protein
MQEALAKMQEVLESPLQENKTTRFMIRAVARKALMECEYPLI